MSINPRFLSLLPVLALHPSPFIPPASAQVCYVVWANGQDQNLDALCRGESVLPNAIASSTTVDPVDTRLVFTDLDIKGSVENSGLGRVVGSFTNRSSAPVRVDFIQFQVSDRRSGDALGSVVAIPGVVLQPGQSARINQPFDNDLIGQRPYGRVEVRVADWL